MISDRSDIVPTMANLAKLITTGRPSAADLFATSIMLTTTAQALMTTFNADHGSVAALHRYRDEMLSVIRLYQTRFSSLDSRHPAPLAQARELRTAGVPRIAALPDDAATAATSELLRVTVALAPATAAVRAEFAAHHARGELLTRSWSEGYGATWRAARDTEADRLLDRLDRAPGVIGTLRSYPVNSPAPSRNVPAPAPEVVDLAGAIARRRASLDSRGRPTDSQRRPKAPDLDQAAAR